MLNLGSNAFDAAQRLKNTEDWKIITEALEEQMGKMLHVAADSADPVICGYARAIRDVYHALWVMEAPPGAAPQRAAAKPPVKARY